MLGWLFAKEKELDCADEASTGREAPVTRGLGDATGAWEVLCDEGVTRLILPVPRARALEPEASWEVVVSLGILEEREGFAALGF